MIQTREKLMLVHSAVFVLNIVVYLSNLIFSLLFHKNLQALTDDIYTDLLIAEKLQRPVELFTSVKPIQVCREFVAGEAFVALTKVFNTGAIVLFIYMSVQFSQPISAVWQQILSENAEEEVARLSEHEKAIRFHEAAVRDANRRISFIQALLTTGPRLSQHISNRPSSYGGGRRSTQLQNEEDTLLITDEERRILTNSCRSEDSEVFFAKVRQSAVDAYGGDDGRDDREMDFGGNISPQSQFADVLTPQNRFSERAEEVSINRLDEEEEEDGFY